MYEVILSKDGVETSRSKPMSWDEAVSKYNRGAKVINHVDAKGNYTRPNERIAIRKV